MMRVRLTYTVGVIVEEKFMASQLKVHHFDFVRCLLIIPISGMNKLVKLCEAA